MSEKAIPDLLQSLETHSEQINSILGVLSHEKRLQILLSLLTGDKSFRELKKETKLKKTALANHLNRLISVQLISKPAYNTYRLHLDGERYLRIFENAYQQSSYKIKIDKEKIETRQFSEGFVTTFFGVNNKRPQNKYK
jgi:DNA-binding HxlR family transcriptional regulator